MPRTARIFQQAMCYHVMNRGINRGVIFVDDADRRYFTDLVKDSKVACEASVSKLSDQVDALRKWAKGRARPATLPGEGPSRGRKIAA